MNKKSILEVSLHQLKAYFLPFLQLFTGAELALVPIANITVDHVSPNADVVFLEGYNLLTAFPGLSPVCNAYQNLPYMTVCMAINCWIIMYINMQLLWH